MIENKPVIPEFTDWDPDEEIPEYYPTHILLKKPRRLGKPTRTLTTLRPKTKEIVRYFGSSVKEPYLLELEGSGRAGNHYHTRKMEVFCPVGPVPLVIHLEHVDTHEKETITLSQSKNHLYIAYLIPPRVAHAIINPSILPASYLVLSNMSEKEALEQDDVIDYEVIPLSQK